MADPTFAEDDLDALNDETFGNHDVGGSSLPAFFQDTPGQSSGSGLTGGLPSFFTDDDSSVDGGMLESAASSQSLDVGDFGTTSASYPTQAAEHEKYFFLDESENQALEEKMNSMESMFNLMIDYDNPSTTSNFSLTPTSMNTSSKLNSLGTSIWSPAGQGFGEKPSNMPSDIQGLWGKELRDDEIVPETLIDTSDAVVQPKQKQKKTNDGTTNVLNQIFSSVPQDASAAMTPPPPQQSGMSLQELEAMLKQQGAVGAPRQPGVQSMPPALTPQQNQQQGVDLLKMLQQNVNRQQQKPAMQPQKILQRPQPPAASQLPPILLQAQLQQAQMMANANAQQIPQQHPPALQQQQQPQQQQQQQQQPQQKQQKQQQQLPQSQMPALQSKDRKNINQQEFPSLHQSLHQKRHPAATPSQKTPQRQTRGQNKHDRPGFHNRGPAGQRGKKEKWKALNTDSKHDQNTRQFPASFENKKRMTPAEIASVLRVHEFQLQSWNPFADDFYYQTFRRKQAVKAEQVAAKQHGRTPRRVIAKLHKPMFEAAPAKPQPKSKQDPFGSSLGRVNHVTSRAPRAMLQVTAQSNGTDSKRSASTNADRQEVSSHSVFSLLLSLEDAFNVLLDIEDLDLILDNPETSQKFNVPALRKKRQAFTNELFASLHIPEVLSDDVTDDAFLELMQVRKGRRLLVRTMPLFYYNHVLTVFYAIMRNLHFFVTTEAVTSDIAFMKQLFDTPGYMAGVVKALNANQLATAFSSMTNSHSQSKMSFLMRLSPSLNILKLLLKRGHELQLSMHSRNPPTDFSTSPPEISNWCKSMASFYGAVGGNFREWFDNHSLENPNIILEMLAVLVINTPPKVAATMMQEIEPVLLQSPSINQATVSAFLELAKQSIASPE